jgi:formamidopyrimidine-DNA glycosylase
MPELPEVETIRRQLEPEVMGSRIESLEVLDPRWTEPVPAAQVERTVSGRRVEAMRRRGKHLLMGLEGGLWLVMHLRMTGNLVLSDREHRLGKPRLYESPSDVRFLRVVMRLDDGRELRFTDARRFGTGVVIADAALDDYLRDRAGIEPLSDELTAEAIGALAEGRRAPLKSFLMVQSGIAGIGNIYADEALHRARLHPLSPAGSMRPDHWEDLREGIVETLEAGLSNGGASIDDYRDARGGEGSMQDEFLVHTREGEPCPRCGEAIRRIVVGGRSTYFCPGCQVRLRRRRSARRAARRERTGR